MVILISGATHSGKTVLAQRLLERYHYPYLSIDHLKMALIRSGNTELTPMSDDGLLTDYLWPIVREMIKTAIENQQNLIVEGCYIPFNWKKDFEKTYLHRIRHICIILSERYIKEHFSSIRAHANDVEHRLCDDITQGELITENALNLELCKQYDCEYILVDDDYQVNLTL